MSSPTRTSLRLRRYSGRLWRAVSDTGLSVPLIFMHMPKCGGTSLSEALYAAVPIQKRIGVIDAVSTRRTAALLNFGKDCPWLCHDDLEHGHHTFSFRHGLVLQHMCWDTMLIHGHVQFHHDMTRVVNGTYGFVTVLRDPVRRMISNYRMAHNAGLCDGDFSAYLDTPLAKRHARVYLRYLTGQNTPRPDRLDQLTQLAIDRLDRFALVGILERIEDFSNKFRDRFGPRLRIPRINTGEGKLPNLSAIDNARMTALLYHDQQIYDHACNRNRGQRWSPRHRRERDSGPSLNPDQVH